MALRYNLRLYKGIDAATLRSAMERVAESLAGSIQWGRPGEGLQDLRLAHVNDVHTVYLPNQDGDYTFCLEVGHRLDSPWLELRIQEGSIWDYALYHGRQILDTFSVCPQYWEGGMSDSKELKEWQGNPEVLAKAWDLPVQKVRNYLVNWGYREDPDDGLLHFERVGKAYSTDEFPYGNYEQFFDVLKALGGVEPIDFHTIKLPESAGG